MSLCIQTALRLSLSCLSQFLLRKILQINWQFVVIFIVKLFWASKSTNNTASSNQTLRVLCERKKPLNNASISIHQVSIIKHINLCKI
ncbi:hypothetical protein PUN28_018267 [Cardiocondyla obscurior]|uniref:Secreted protein n=1 Tax=Cardiocondyla obscurior TaxID=286306 RepID=A0AAW2EIS7_9HYME